MLRSVFSTLSRMQGRSLYILALLNTTAVMVLDEIPSDLSQLTDFIKKLNPEFDLPLRCGLTLLDELDVMRCRLRLEGIEGVGINVLRILNGKQLVCDLEVIRGLLTMGILNTIAKIMVAVTNR